MGQKHVLIAFLTFALGVWLIATPFTFNYASHPIFISDCCAGFFLLILGGIASIRRSNLLGWCIVIVGIWLQFAPLVFWAPTALMYFSDTLIGMAAFILGFMLNKKEEVPSVSLSNPSSWSHRLSVAILALLCSCFARYMAVFQLGYTDSIWDPFFSDGTFKVITSSLSKSFPVSDAGLGALCYTIEFLLAWQGGSNRWRQMPWLVCSFAFLVIPVGIVSVLLIISQPLIVGAWCSWCLATAILMLIMIVLAAPEFKATFRLLAASRRQGKSVWTVFWKGE